MSDRHQEVLQGEFLLLRRRETKDQEAHLKSCISTKLTVSLGYALYSFGHV